MASSDENDHFSDASEGRVPRGAGHSHSASNSSNSPVPITRVERVDDEPRYGEVPNTEAYSKRTQDAVPDEVEIIPDGQRSRASSRLRAEDRPSTPLGPSVPKMVVEKIDPDELAYGDVPGTEAYEKRKADAQPDEIIKSPAGGRTENPWNASNRSSDGVALTTAEQTQSKNDWEADDEEQGDDEAGFGDDFDDFEEGAEADGEDFGDFDEGFAAPADSTYASVGAEPTTAPSLPASLSSGPTPDFRDLSQDELQDAIKPLIAGLFPNIHPSEIDPTAFPTQPSSVLSDRSLSLWSQLVAPPPIQPPNWTRSHIRRLFLVSIGVPLDLDEILPRSTQKKLILPSIDISGRSPRPSSEEKRPGGAAEKLKMRQRNGSDTSLASTESRTAEKKKNRQSVRGPPPPPLWDPSEAMMLASRTDAALHGFSDEELRAHVSSLHDCERKGREVLEYWARRREEAEREKEAFEGVIENLVKHARNVRK